MVPKSASAPAGQHRLDKRPFDETLVMVPVSKRQGSLGLQVSEQVAHGSDLVQGCLTGGRKQHPLPVSTLRLATQHTGAAVLPAGSETAAEEGWTPFAWKHNALRHSFISYRVAETQDVAKVSLEAGNSPQMIFKHYRELVRPDAAKAWFALMPAGKN